LYPRKEEKGLKGKSQVPAKKSDWVPIPESPFGVGSSKAFEVPPPKAPLIIIPTVEDIATNMVPTQKRPQPQTQQASKSFSFALQNVSDEIP